MKNPFAVLCLTAMVAGPAWAAEPRAPSDAEIRAKQALGRVLVSPDGKLLVYEWMRPYNWVRDPAGVPAAAASRMQTWLYRVDVGRTPVTSDYLFFPGSGDSYWLGAFSPGGDRISFYELDNDDKSLKLGVATLDDPITPKLTWFGAAPDGGKLADAPLWISDHELVYPAAGGSRVIANADTGETRPCEGCDAVVAAAKQAAPAGRKGDAKGIKLPAGARLLARSGDGELTVYEKSDSNSLSLLYEKVGDMGGATLVFENERKLAAWSPPKWPVRKAQDAGGKATDGTAAPQ
jgi:hypothetical protein